MHQSSIHAYLVYAMITGQSSLELSLLQCAMHVLVLPDVFTPASLHTDMMLTEITQHMTSTQEVQSMAEQVTTRYAKVVGETNCAGSRGWIDAQHFIC